MNTSHGWIKLHRCLLDDAVCQKSAYFHLWVTLLLMAAHTDREFIFNNRIQKLKPGQLITGRKKLSKLTGIPEMTIEHILKLFVNSGRIQQQKNNKFRVITITKWEDYQHTEIVQHQIFNNSSSNQQPVVTYKNDKNDNKHRGCDYLSSEQKEIQRADANFEKAKAEFLRQSGSVS